MNHNTNYENDEIIKLVLIKEEDEGNVNIEDDYFIKLHITNKVDASDHEDMENEMFVPEIIVSGVSDDNLESREYSDYSTEENNLLNLIEDGLEGYNDESAGEEYVFDTEEEWGNNFEPGSPYMDHTEEEENNNDSESYFEEEKIVEISKKGLNKNNKKKEFICGICGYSSFKQTIYRRHLQIHFKPEGIYCSICREIMESKSKLKAHMDIHRCPEDETKYQCHICPFTSKYMSNVSQHTDLHYRPEKATLKCDQCSFSTTEKKRLKAHNMKTHEKKFRRIRERSLKCPVCALTFPNLKLKQRHVQKYRSREDPKKYQCPECSYSSIKFSHFEQHILVHRSEHEVDMFLCPKCPFKTKRKTDLKRHITIRHQTEEDMYKCDFCTYKSKRGHPLTSHMKMRHEHKIVVKNCCKCSYKTVSQVLFDRHLLRHESLLVECGLFKCSFCSLEFEDNKSLLVHETTDHVQKNQLLNDDCESKKIAEKLEDGDDVLEIKEDESGVRYRCLFPGCSFESDEERDVNIHRTLIHYKKGDDNRCPDCTFHTVCRRIFLEHLAVHKIDYDRWKPHLCEFCGKKLMRRADLTKHMFYHWTGEKPKKYSSNFKEENAKEKGSSSKTIWQCGICDFSCKMRFNLFKHMSKHGKKYQSGFNNIVIIDTESESE